MHYKIGEIVKSIEINWGDLNKNFWQKNKLVDFWNSFNRSFF